MQRDVRVRYFSITGRTASVVLDMPLFCTAGDLVDWAEGLCQEMGFLSFDPFNGTRIDGRSYAMDFDLDGSNPDHRSDSLTDSERAELANTLQPVCKTGVMASASVVHKRGGGLAGVKIVLNCMTGPGFDPNRLSPMTGVGKTTIKTDRIAMKMANPTVDTAAVIALIKRICDTQRFFIEGEIQLLGFDDDGLLFEEFDDTDNPAGSGQRLLHDGPTT